MPIDIIFIAVFGYGFWQGYTRGIISTIFNVLGYIFGVVLAFKMTPTTTNLLERLFNTANPSLFLAAFIVNIVFIMFILRTAARGLEGVFRTLYLGVINQLAGGAVLGSIAILVYSVLIWFAVKVQFLNEVTIRESKTYPILRDLPSTAKSIAVRFQPVTEDVWGTALKWMNNVQSYGVEKTATKPRVYELPDDGKGIEPDPDAPRPVTTPKDNEGNGIED